MLLSRPDNGAIDDVKTFADWNWTAISECVRPRADIGMQTPTVETPVAHFGFENPNYSLL